MAIPDDIGPDESGPDDPSGAPGDSGGSPGDPGRVSDADWRRVVEDLTGPAEARGTRDSFVQHAGQLPAGRPTPPAKPHAPYTPGAPYAQYGVPGPDAPGASGGIREAGWPGVLASAAASWRRALAAIDRWLRKPPASLTLPAGSQIRFTIGREPACDMTLLDRTVSRWHACLKREDDGWLLTDLGSTNGTRLNGWRVNAPIVVSPGDLVSFGAATFVLTERPGRLR